MHLAASSNESDILCIFGWSISKSIEKMRPQHVEPFPIIVATVDPRFDWRRSNDTKSNEPNFNCRRLWKEINCQSRFKCTTFESTKECFHQGSPVLRLRTRLRSVKRVAKPPLIDNWRQYHFSFISELATLSDGVFMVSVDYPRTRNGPTMKTVLEHNRYWQRHPHWRRIRQNFSHLYRLLIIKQRQNWN